MKKMSLINYLIGVIVVVNIMIVNEGGASMIHSKVTRSGQVTIPKPLREEIGLDEGDYVEIVRVPEGILLKPKKMQLMDLTSSQTNE